MKGNILIVDDEENIREILAATLKPVSHRLFKAASAADALKIVPEENLDVVVSDIRMPGMDGIEFLKNVKEEHPDIRFLMVTAHGNMETVVQAMRFGASDFITKPFDNAKVREIVQKLILEKQQRKEPLVGLGPEGQLDGIIGESDQFLRCLKVAMKAAKTDSNVLILGESGTGKEVLARAIHEASDRKLKPFIPINCGAIPDNLLESELFGYEKGAFTGALESKPGKFILADKGTIFLDEIGELPLPMQVKLLRVLQERVVDAVGGVRAVNVDFRLLSATNRDLETFVKEGGFREDLFYRLNIIPVELPPLRDRGNDILLLAEYILKRFNSRYSTGFRLTNSVRQALLGYSWPGNIRELENVIERAVVLGEDSELALTLPRRDAVSPGQDENDFKSKKRKHEKEEIVQALERNRWNKTKTADELGISRRSLLYKVKEYEIC